MRFIKNFLLWFAIILTGIIILMYIFEVNYLLRAVRTIYFRGETTAFLDDYKEFPNRTIAKGTVQPWAIHKDYNKVKATQRLEEAHEKLETVAYLIIKNDSIWHESYYDGYDKDSKSNSFSMAKSVVSAALFKAIEEGKIKSLNQKVGDYFPEFSEGLAAEMTVGDLSSMASGLSWDEKYYSPFSIVTRAYFDDHLDKVILGLKVVDEPGKEFKYLSGATELLAMVITKATGQTLSDYVSDKFWKPMGMENDALWQVDNLDGIEKAYCCIGSNARDFSRFGKLFQHHGNWDDRELLNAASIQKMINPRFVDTPYYGYGWWINNYMGKKMFYMRGHLGQFVIVIPDDKIIITRLGHLKGLQTSEDVHSNDFYVYVDEAYKMMGLMQPSEGEGNSKALK
ncbi:class C beta-lactamase-related serine hydrolase [Flavobacterium arcticum]|uniref:Class C beta-lactamase-related serine hydrolase n=1 Tax=Flavobacterium arcticum TaxID=1784713 RepID=A0A345HAY7_9FLAO|nr:serine hydrolase [Flavobacterium arcticum]AXG73747.1 class C beta-lactamase-related serine hydrolase [Flavobacterium arcticum]KAF2511698.1 serine hydrolase [Flavobacterium arcticum]